MSLVALCSETTQFAAAKSGQAAPNLAALPTASMLQSAVPKQRKETLLAMQLRMSGANKHLASKIQSLRLN